MADAALATGVEARDAGLKRALGPWSLGANVFNITVGSGIFVLPAALWREAGPSAPLAYVACTVVMAGVVACFAAAASRASTSGGAYGYVEAAFGPFAGFLTGALIWLGAVLAVAGVTSAIADLAGRAHPALAQPWARAAIITVLLGALAAVNIGGVAWGARLVRLTTALKLLPLALLLLACAFWAWRSPAAPAPPAAGGAGLARAMLLAIFAFQGLETALSVSGEVKDASRNVPRGLIGALAAVSVLYILIQLGVQRVLGPALGGSTAPLADAARALWRPLGPVLLAGTAASMVGYLAGDVLSTPRLLFAFGRDGSAPGVLGRLGARSAAPYVAILAHVAIAWALALSGGFEELVILASLTTVAVYAVGCVAAVVLQRRNIALAGAPMRVPGLEVFALVGVGGMIWLALNAKPAEVLGLGIALGVCALFYAAERWRRRRA